MTSNTIQMAATAGGEALAYEAVAGELIAAQNELVQSMMSAESAKQNAMRTRETLKREEAKLLATGEIPGKNQPERDANLRLQLHKEYANTLAAEILASERASICEISKLNYRTQRILVGLTLSAGHSAHYGIVEESGNDTPD